MIQRRLHHRTATLGLCLALLLPPASLAAQSPAPAAELAATGKTDVFRFLAGAGLGLLIHESGHLVFDALFDAHPRIEAVHFGPVPFFAITPTRPLSARQLFTVTSAGFWTQELSSEILQKPSRDLRHRDAPLEKGMLAFDVLTSVGYSLAAMLEVGPVQRDTRGMAVGLGVPEPAIGAIVLTPAVLEAYRYYRPDSRWAKWATRVVAAGSVLLLVRAPHTQS